MKVFTLSLAVTLLLISTSLGIAGEDPDLVAYFPFDGNSEDASGNDNHGEIDGGSNWVKGKFGDAIELDAAAFVLLQVSDSLHGDIFKADPFTISAWIKPNFEGTEWEHIWRSLPTASGHNTFFLNKNQGLLSWRGQVAGWTVLCQSEGGIVEKDKWMHVARLRATAINSGFMRTASRSPKPTSRKPARQQCHLSSWRLKVARRLPVRWTMSQSSPVR